MVITLNASISQWFGMSKEQGIFTKMAENSSRASYSTEDANDDAYASFMTTKINAKLS